MLLLSLQPLIPCILNHDSATIGAQFRTIRTKMIEAPMKSNFWCNNVMLIEQKNTNRPVEMS